MAGRIAVPELRRLVEAAGGTWPSGELVEMVEALAEFSTIGDRREGDNRLVFKPGNESRTDNRARQTYQAARALGLAHSEAPTMAEPDHLLILGGLAIGVEPRVRYAAELLAPGAVRARALAALGSFRPVDERERAMADTYAPVATSELDLLTVETVGVPTRDGAITHPPRSYRQEIRSTLRSARALLQALG